MIPAAARDSWKELDARLRPFVARRVQPADVDDVVQDVLLRMHRHASSVRDGDRFGPWVYRVARSAIVDHHRASVRTDTPAEVIDPPAPEPEHDRTAEAECAPVVAWLVSMLPSPYREAITLVELEGVSQVEAAKMLGISTSGMKSRVQRGRAKLRELFEQCCKVALDTRGRIIACEPRAASSCECGTD
jgi:RNA polymerase sigma-70 factor (ECF subfamily)